MITTHPFLSRIATLFGPGIAADCERRLSGNAAPTADELLAAIWGAVTGRIKPFRAQPRRLTRASPIRGRVTAGR